MSHIGEQHLCPLNGGVPKERFHCIVIFFLKATALEHYFTLNKYLIFSNKINLYTHKHFKVCKGKSCLVYCNLCLACKSYTWLPSIQHRSNWVHFRHALKSRRELPLNFLKKWIGIIIRSLALWTGIWVVGWNTDFYRWNCWQIQIIYWALKQCVALYNSCANTRLHLKSAAQSSQLALQYMWYITLLCIAICQFDLLSRWG